jgi:DNA modification methylase
VSHGVIHVGDCRRILPTLPAESVDCVVTSPPYWGLRSYLPDGHPDKAQELGCEATPQEYVANLVAVFREVRRVLRRSGTVWLNLGDSYNNRTKVRSTSHQPALNGFTDARWADRAISGGVRMTTTRTGIKEKDLCMIPARVALALQADGWWLRSAITWAKTSSMPESVTDRPTSATEQVFLLVKSGESVYWTHRDLPGTHVRPQPDYCWVHEDTGEEIDARPADPKGWRRVNLWQGHDYFYDAAAVAELAEHAGRRTTTYNGTQKNGKASDSAHERRTLIGSSGERNITVDSTRNMRNFWLLGPDPYPEAHFAVMPREVARRCILAGSSARGVCPECGAPWGRAVERDGDVPMTDRHRNLAAAATNGVRLTQGGGATRSKLGAGAGWRPTCTHAAEPVPATVLDPFLGAGTTALVASGCGRRWVGIELSETYAHDLAQNRIGTMFCEVRSANSAADDGAII